MQGKTLSFRNATVHDAAVILALRTDAEKSRYLSPVSGELAAQVAWLQRYAQQDDQAYSVIEHQNQPIGTVRLYDAQAHSFCRGSWVLSGNRPSHAAMESALMVYAYAVDHLGFATAHFDVRKGNKRVWRFHERFGAVKTAETDIDHFYQMDNQAIATARKRYQRFLAGSVSATFL